MKERERERGLELVALFVRRLPHERIDRRRRFPLEEIARLLVRVECVEEDDLGDVQLAGSEEDVATTETHANPMRLSQVVQIALLQSSANHFYRHFIGVSHYLGVTHHPIHVHRRLKEPESDRALTLSSIRRTVPLRTPPQIRSEQRRGKARCKLKQKQPSLYAILF